MKRGQLFLILVLSLAAIPAVAVSDMLEPFVTSNLSPFVQIHNLPSARPAKLLKKGAMQIRLTSEIANNFTSDSSDGESITIDGETWRNQLYISYGLSDRWELSIVIPHVIHDGGSFDGFIEGWHKVFGLPNRNREAVAKDQLNYHWQNNGSSQVNIMNSRRGLGDIRLQVAYRRNDTENRSISLVGGVKVPTGDSDDLLGSSSTDIFAGLYLSQRDFFGRADLTFHSSAGVMLLGNSDLPRTKDWLGYSSASLIWHPWLRVALKTQLDIHSAVYDSALRELGDFSAQISLGGTIALTDKTSLDIGVVEDIVTDTSPDVVFQFSLRRQF